MKAKLAAFVVVLFVAFVLWAADAGAMPGFIRAIYKFPNGDRVGHVGVYAVLGLTLCLAFPSRVRLLRCSISIATTALLGFALVEEISQQFFASRTADLVDLLCSWVGVAIGGAIASLWTSKCNRRSVEGN